MKGEQLIIQLLRVKEQYKYKPCYTGEVSIPSMIDDVITEINRLTSKNAHDEYYIELWKVANEKTELLNKLTNFIENEYLAVNTFHYSDSGNQYRQGRKSCLKEILCVINE